MAGEFTGEMKGEISTETVPCMHVEWKVPEDIILLPRGTDHRIHSPSFHFKGATWYLRLKIHAAKRGPYQSIDPIDLYLVKKYPLSSALSVLYSIGIKGDSGNEYKRSYNEWQISFKERDEEYWGDQLLRRLELSRRKESLAPSGVVRFFCYFWVEIAENSCSASRTSLSDVQSTNVSNQLSENIGEISAEILTTMYVEWKVSDIHLLSEDTKHTISSSSFQFKDEVWYLQAIIHETEYWHYAGFGQVNGPIDIHLIRKECISPTLYVECYIGLKLTDGNLCKVRHKEYVFDTNLDCRMLTDLSRLDEVITESANGELTFFCYFRLETSGCSNAGSNKMPEGNLGQITAVPTVSSPCALNWIPETPKYSSDNNLSEEESWEAEEECSEAEEEDRESKAYSQGKQLKDIDLMQELQKRTGTSKLSEDFKNLFISGEHSDLKIKVKDTEFKVHKNILCARSSVFHSMLSHDMLEKNSGTIDIIDSEPDAFKIFLLYLYNGCVENLSTDTVFDVYKAADKYDAEELKLKCKAFMLTSLSVDNVCHVIDHALQHNEEDLLKTSTDFFAKNFKKIILTVSWQTFLKKNTVAANELLIKVSNCYVLTQQTQRHRSADGMLPFCRSSGAGPSPF